MDIAEMLGATVAVEMIGDYSVTCNLFSPAELSRMTDIPVALQRLWRKRGFLPKLREGQPHARFSTLDVAWLALAYRLTRFGWGPEEAIAEAKEYAVLLCHFMLFIGNGSYSLEDDMEEFDEDFIAAKEQFEDAYDDRYILMCHDENECELVSSDELEDQHLDVYVLLNLKRTGRSIKNATDRALFIIDVGPIARVLGLAEDSPDFRRGDVTPRPDPVH